MSYLPRIRRTAGLNLIKKMVARNHVTVSVENVPRKVAVERSNLAMLGLPADQTMFNVRMVCKPRSGNFLVKRKKKIHTWRSVESWCFTSFPPVGNMLRLEEVWTGQKGAAYMSVVRTLGGYVQQLTHHAHA